MEECSDGHRVKDKLHETHENGLLGDVAHISQQAAVPSPTISSSTVQSSAVSPPLSPTSPLAHSSKEPHSSQAVHPTQAVMLGANQITRISNSIPSASSIPPEGQERTPRQISKADQAFPVNRAQRFISPDGNHMTGNSIGGEYIASMVEKGDLKWGYRISAQEYLSETDCQSRNALRMCLTDVVIQCLERDQAVYLEGLGIVFPEITAKQRVQHVGDKQIITSERHRTAKFEKCSELVNYHRESFPQLKDTKDLAQLVHKRLPTTLDWHTRAIQRYIRGFVQLLKYNLIATGKSEELRNIGTLYAIHNRQGDQFEDWFAGSDIFLESSYTKSISLGGSKVWMRPCVYHAWELLEAHFGKARTTFELDVVCELYELETGKVALEHHADYQAFRARVLSELPEEQSRIRVAAFVKEDPRTGTRVTYCTDGLRDLGIRLSANLSANLPANQQQTSNGDRACDRCVWGSEITLQLQLEPLNRHSRLTLEERELQLYPCRALTVAWTLLRSTVDLRLEPGLAMSAGTSLFKHFDCPLRSIFCTPLSFAHEEQRAEDGNFYYVNLACLTDDEADACRLYGSEYIKKILRYKGFDQITRPVRLSVLHRTGFSESLSG